MESEKQFYLHLLLQVEHVFQFYKPSLFPHFLTFLQRHESLQQLIGHFIYYENQPLFWDVISQVLFPLDILTVYKDTNSLYGKAPEAVRLIPWLLSFMFLGLAASDQERTLPLILLVLKGSIILASRFLIHLEFILVSVVQQLLIHFPTVAVLNSLTLLPFKG